mgnify:CR=1 FL=1
MPSCTFRGAFRLPRNLLEERIIPLVEGNPLGARLLAVEMSQGSSYTEELVNGLTRKFYEYLNQAIYSEWPEEIREMMMQLSLLEHFTIQQAEEMTGRSDVNRLLAQAAEMGNLFSIKDGGYTAARRHQQHEAADGDGLRSGAGK